MYLAHYFLANTGVMPSTYLVPVQCNGSKGQHRHMDRAVLNKPADVTH